VALCGPKLRTFTPLEIETQAALTFTLIALVPNKINCQMIIPFHAPAAIAKALADCLPL
jgi:hypothetical protein